MMMMIMIIIFMMMMIMIIIVMMMMMMNLYVYVSDFSFYNYNIGNHDQVTLGGRVHALEPLLYAFPSNQILMIDEPSICMGALWLPYRRDEKIMQKILQSTLLTSNINSGEISMIFCHADVKGAFMNDGIRSRDGIDVEVFPKNVPIFSGHFHKPHTVW